MSLHSFYGLEYQVSPDVLPPYATTEKIVDHAIETLKGVANPTICDMGIGSGNIAISLLKAYPTATVMGIDISLSALEMARANAKTHAVSDRLKLCQANGLVGHPYDLIVCNSPYLPKDLARGLEPQIAYTDGSDGLTLIRQLAETAPRYLKPGGLLIVEYFLQFVDRIVEMFGSPWANIEVLFHSEKAPLGIKVQMGQARG